MVMQLRVWLAALLLIGLPLTTKADGCGVPAFVGMGGERLLYRVLQGDRPVAFVVTPESRTGASVNLERGSLSGRPGNGSRLWSATRTGEHAARVRVAQILPDGEHARALEIALPFVPLEFSWSEDRLGAAWLFFGGMLSSERRVAAYREVDGAWRFVGEVATELRPPRFDRHRDRFLVGAWMFSSKTAPAKWSEERLPECAPPDEVELFPTDDGEVVVISRDRQMWLSVDEGSTWARVPVPFADAPAGTVELVPSVDGRPAVAWRSGDVRRIAQWGERKWTVLADVPKGPPDRGGPIVVLAKSVVVMGGCYHMDGEEWIDRRVIVAGQAVDSRVVVGR